MFWSDVRARTISQAKLDGSEVTVLVSSGLSVVGKDHDNKLILHACMSIYAFVVGNEYAGSKSDCGFRDIYINFVPQTLNAAMVIQ